MKRSLLCDASDFFRSVLRGTVKKEKQRKLRLPDCDTDVFELLLYWICNKRLPDLESQVDLLSWEDEARDESTHAVGVVQETSVRLWYAAGRYLLPVLQDEIMLSLMSILENMTIDPIAMRTAFEKDPDGESRSAMFRMLLDQFSRSFSGMSTDDKGKKWLDEFGEIHGFLAEFASMVRPASESEELEGDDESEEFEPELLDPTKYLISTGQVAT